MTPGARLSAAIEVIADIEARRRPAADALYRSELEPPSEYLQAHGQPEAHFDALQEWVTACHAHGLELHAWFNPYRIANHTDPTKLVASTPISLPSWVTSEVRL